MQSANEELILGVVDAINARDAERFLTWITEDFEWSTPVPNLEPVTYRGAEGARQYFRDLKHWQSVHARLSAIHDLGERALVLGELNWHGYRSSLDVKGPLASIFYFREGRIARMHTYRNEAHARAVFSQGAAAHMAPAR